MNCIAEYEERCSSPGKFEGEQRYVPYFWEKGLEGGANEDVWDEEISQVYYIFEILPEDVVLFPELKDVTKLYLQESEQGFVCSTVEKGEKIMPNEKSFLSPMDYQDAIDVQDACNLSGVLYSFAKVMEKICQEDRRLGKGTDWKNNHCIVRMYVNKLESLCHSEETFSEAYAECKKGALEE